MFVGNKPTLIITGAGGWLGSSLIDILNKKNSFAEKFRKIILCTSSKLDVNPKNQIKNLSIATEEVCWVYGDLFLDGFYEKLLKNINAESDITVIYAASIIHANSSKEFFRTNVSSLKKFISKIKNFKLNQFLYISSNSPFGFNNNKPPFNEQSKYNPIGNYGKSKKLAELFLLSKLDKNKLKIIRAPWFHGNNMPDRQKLFLKKAALGSFPIIFPGKNRRAIINTLDLGIAALNLVTRESKNNIYWVCERDSISMKNFSRIINKAALKNGLINSQKKLRFLFLPPFTSSICCFIDRVLQRVGIYSKIIHVMGELGMNIEADSTLYSKEFKDHVFTPIEKSIDEEIKEAFT